LNNLDDQKYARTTIEGVHVTAGMIFKYAMKEKLRKDSPVFGAVVPAKLRTVEEIENTALEDGYLEREELEEFFKVVREQGMKGDLETFYLLAFSGMRSGEVCALKWSDLNFVTNEVRITKTLYNPDNNMVKYELTPPKTPAAIRTVEIDQSVMDLLKALQKRQAKVKMNTRHLIEDFHDMNFVFCRGNGYPFIQKSILTRMARLLKKTTIKKEATPHIFRHTHISMLSEAGVDLITIMKRVGHDDAKTTTKIYTHVTNKMKSDATEKVKFQFANLLSF
jgi:integrase